MADIRCPMCAKPNPAERDTCQYCGARLKPVTEALAAANDSIRPGEEPTRKSTAELEKALPDWLRNIRQGDSAGEPSAPEEGGFSSGGEDDFLSRLSGEAPSPEPASPSLSSSQQPANNDFLAGLAASSSDDEDVPDWLASIQGQVQKEVQSLQAQTEHPSAAGEDDWLTRLHEEEKPAQSQPLSGWAGGFGQETPAGEPTTYFEPDEFKPAEGESDWMGAPSDGPVSSDTPDWLKTLEASHPSAPSQARPASSTQDFVPSGDMPDWLSGLDSGQPAAPAAGASFTPPAADDTPDWLRAMETSQPAAPAQAASFTPPVADDTPDWLRAMETSQPAAPAQGPSFTPPAADDTPDWLRDLETSQPAAPIQPAASRLPDDDLSGWFDQEAAPAATPAASSDESQGWFSSLEAGTPQNIETPAVQAEPAISSDLPDWFSDLPPGQPAAAAETPSFASEIPDWLSDLGGSAPAQPADEGVPDWLAGAAAVGATLEGVTPSQEEERPTDLPDLFATAPGEESSGWLSSMGQADTPAALAGLELSTNDTDALTGQLPDWLSNMAPAASPTPPVSGTPAFIETQDAGGEILGLDMPDWLSNIQGSGVPAGGEPPSAPVLSDGVDDALSPTELPSWVQAMRPVESVISEPADSEEDQYVESQGPLAGMRNVLPIVTGLISIRRPAPYSSKLQVNEVQQSNAAVLESLLIPEGESAALAGKSGKSMRFLRWMIALLLVVLVALPIAFGSSVQITPASNLYPPELLAVVSAIELLPASPRVLVVFDYEPSFSGEMAVAATPLLDHLMLRQARLAIVSSIPTGVVQSETLLHTNLALHNYRAGAQYVNLGYIPGGAVGIYNFANAPSTVLPLDVDGSNPWRGSTTFLADLSQLNQFDAMVVITDSSETGRIWIEQTRKALGDNKPLLMAISAQAEPMLRPYVDSQQVQGMVTGLAGGASYEQRILRPGLGREYWDSFSVAFLVAEVIVIVGGLWALFTAWHSRRNQSKDEA